MLRGTAVCVVIAMMAGANAPCQTFDVASVKANHTGKSGGNLATSPGMVTIRNLPLRMIIAAAYGIADYQVSGPRWLDQERFDIVAKSAGAGADEETVLPLLQPLLAERFHMAMHRETRQLPAYALTVGTSGPKLAAADAGSAGLPFKKANKAAGGRIHSDSLTMPQFAQILSRRLGYPVLDMTGLAGAYRVTLEWAAEDRVTKPGKADKVKPEKDRPSIFTAVREQMGLRLQARKAKIDIVVIDRMEKNPTEN